MTTLYKITDAGGQTYGGTQWGMGIEHTAPGTGPLCSAGHIHAYTDPLLAALLDPIHGKFGPTARLWQADGDIRATDYGLKVGCSRLCTLHEIPLPRITLEQSIAFGILTSRCVYHDASWIGWADAWLDGSDRSAEAAKAAWEAAKAAEWEAKAAWEAGKAAEWAAWAAWEAGKAGKAAEWAAKAAWEAEWAAWAAAKAAAWAAAAWAAAEEAAEAAEAAADIDLIALAHQACDGGAT